jgi:hypothetical protein
MKSKSYDAEVLGFRFINYLEVLRFQSLSSLRNAAPERERCVIYVVSAPFERE